MMAIINGPNARKETIDDPVPQTVERKNTYIVKISVPVVYRNTGKVVGRVGVEVNTAYTQPVVDDTIKAHPDITAMTVYTDNSFIIASGVIDQVGKLLKVHSVLKKIKDSIDKITKSTESVLNKFEAIDSGVRTVSDQEENIRNAMEEQGEGSKQVFKESKNLESVTQEISEGMSEMTIGADQINVAVNRVNTISGKNKENIDMLVREVSKFKMK
jgi:uncharacterized phage infection (PIP) family protein YhgE